MNGNHRQVDDAKAPYAFSTPERLVEHFRKDVGLLRGES
jgi:hypothetical protein